MTKKKVLPDNSKDAGIIRFDQGMFDILLGNLKVLRKTDLDASIKQFEELGANFDKLLKQFITVFSEQHLLSGFLIWAKRNFSKTNYANCIKMLIEKNIIPFVDKNERLLVVKDINKIFFVNILDSIRCRKDVDIWQREMLVSTFLDFVHWMWGMTLLPAFDIKDPDKEKTARRFLAHGQFIKFLNELDDKCQLVANLLYFGGSRTLAEILNIQLKDIDFKTCCIIFDSQSISYPKHVLEDVMILTRNQTAKTIFTGRNKTSLNPATVFRNFKEASLKLGLEVVYTPKTLITDV